MRQVGRKQQKGKISLGNDRDDKGGGEEELLTMGNSAKEEKSKSGK